MSDVKTCEQYVLNRMQELENENEELHNKIAELSVEVGAFEAFKRLLCKHITLRSLERDPYATGNRYIHMEDIDEWRSDEKRNDLEAIITVLNLVDLDAAKEDKTEDPAE